MKLRSKLLLSATCLLTISVAATATSAYAWFTANRQVYLKSTASVNTNVTNLNVKGVTAASDDTANFSTTAVSGTLGAVESKVAITDISGDGNTFYKPELPADGSTASAIIIKQVSNGTPTDTNYYHQFKLEFTQTNTSISTGVFLANDSTVTAVNTSGDNSAMDSALANSIRVSITVGKKTIYWAPNENSTSINAFYLAGATAEVVSLTTANNKEVKSTSGIGNQIVGRPAVYNDASSGKSTATELLGTLNSSIQSLTATIRVWAEGMDSNCVNLALGGHINVNLVFNGVNMSI